jgi:uncharacterized alkaline shock family protein YloU
MTEYLISTAVLEAIVRGSLEGDARLRVHSGLPLVRARAIEIEVEDQECHATVHLDARMGEHLPSLAVEARQKIVSALTHMTGLVVSGVDIVFSSVFPADA